MTAVASFAPLALVILLVSPAVTSIATPAYAQTQTPASSSSASDTFSLPAFRAEVDRLVTALDAAKRADAAAAIAAQVPPRWRIVDGPTQVDIATAWLTMSLQAAPREARAWAALKRTLRARLIAIRDEAAAVNAADRVTARARARASVPQILAREEFQQTAASRWRDRLQERVAAWLDRLFSAFGGGVGGRRRVALILAWLAALSALVVLGVGLARTLAGRSSESGFDLAAAALVQPRARELALRALAEARALAVREAVRSAYHAALARFEEDGVWRIDEARTPREYLPMLHTLGAADTRRAPMLDLTRQFEQIWYGNRAVAADDSPRLTAALEALGCLRPGERAI